MNPAPYKIKFQKSGEKEKRSIVCEMKRAAELFRACNRKYTKKYLGHGI